MLLWGPKVTKNRARNFVFCCVDSLLINVCKKNEYEIIVMSVNHYCLQVVSHNLFFSWHVNRINSCTFTENKIHSFIIMNGGEQVVGTNSVIVSANQVQWWNLIYSF